MFFVVAVVVAVVIFMLLNKQQAPGPQYVQINEVICFNQAFISPHYWSKIANYNNINVVLLMLLLHQYFFTCTKRTIGDPTKILVWQSKATDK